MNRDRLDWIISGLNQYRLTEREVQFIKMVEQEFHQNNRLTDLQEEKIENLYKEKSKLIPNKNYFSPKPSRIKDKGVKRPHGKIIP